MVVPWLSIGWLLRYVSRRTFVPFGAYHLFAGALVLVLASLRELGRP